MVSYLFRGGQEYVKVYLDKNRTIFISNKFTGDKFVELTPKLFSGNREKRAKLKLMMLKLPKLNEDEVDVYLVLEFLKMGYTLVKKG